MSGQTNETLEERQAREAAAKAEATARMLETEEELARIEEAAWGGTGDLDGSVTRPDCTALALCSLGRLLIWALRTDALE